MRNRSAAIAPTNIVCPRERVSAGCHLVVGLSRSSGAVLESVECPYPLGAIRVGATRLFWLDGISVANVNVRSKEDVRGPSRTLALGASVGDVRGVAVAGDTLVVMTPAGLVAVSPDDPVPRRIVQETAGWAIAASEQYAAWITGRSGSNEGTVNRIDLRSSAVATITGEVRPAAVAVAAGGVYWTNLGMDWDGAIRRSVNGDAATTLVPNQPAPRSIAVDGENVYWIASPPEGRRLRCVPVRGGPIREIATVPEPRDTAGVERLVVVGGNAYYLIAGQLGMAMADGAAPVRVVALPANGRVVDFDADAQHLFLTVEIRPEHEATVPAGRSLRSE
jgi:hypothetical protein